MHPLLIAAAIVVFIFALTAFTGAPYVPSFKKELRLAFRELYKLGKKDFVVDLGSGDGVVLKVAGEFGAGGLGVEINPILVVLSKIRLHKYKNISIREENLFKTSLPPETTVVYIFGEDRDISRMVKHVQNEANRLNKTLNLISHGFQIPKYETKKQFRAYFLYEITPQ